MKLLAKKLVYGSSILESMPFSSWKNLKKLIPTEINHIEKLYNRVYAILTFGLICFFS